ncbi:type VI secretion system baseplate subunit TssF [Azohydromonas aeria]|uniref:type VI secretion system baseplate subunit TssF n=1 Tax=Azohydromonas aeria TaxID=2590212 RepID=UPI0012FC4693|nr:type VI secretion system baseplate subunit TssF [Azohydromonas aeria]
MQRLLTHYEHELTFLREEAPRFARDYPRIAGQLADTGDTAHDPHVERLLQAFAMLTARVHKRLDDDFALVTQWLLQLLQPQALRPFPGCAIVRFEPGGSLDRLPGATALPRGTVLEARPVRRVACRFTTTAPAQLLPVRVVSAAYRAGVSAPPGTALPQRATAQLSLQLELGAAVPSWQALGTDHIRLFLDGDPSLVTLLRETLCGHVAATLVQTGAPGPWRAEAGACPRQVGLEEGEALIDPEARAHPAGRLLGEYFAFAEKFNFIDLPLPQAARHAQERRLALHFVLAAPRGGHDAARLLSLVTAANFLTQCVPAINLFRRHAVPVRISHRSTTYPVLADEQAAAAHEVYSIDRVTRVRQTPLGTQVQPVAPLHALRHEALLRGDGGRAPYWHAQRNEAVARVSPGYETEIGLADPGFDPAAPGTDTLSIELRATQRELPSRLRIGHPGGDLRLAGEGSDTNPWEAIRLLRKPTPPQRLELAQEGLRRLLSRLSLGHLSLAGAGIDGLKELLRLHAPSGSAQAERLVQGLLQVEYRTVRDCVAGNPFATLVCGTGIRLVVDEQHFVGSGLRLFAQVLERSFALQARLNTFTRLVLVSAHTGDVLFAGARRSGHGVLA